MLDDNEEFAMLLFGNLHLPIIDVLYEYDEYYAIRAKSSIEGMSFYLHLHISDDDRGCLYYMATLIPDQLIEVMIKLKVDVRSVYTEGINFYICISGIDAVTCIKTLPDRYRYNFYCGKILEIIPLPLDWGDDLFDHEEMFLPKRGVFLYPQTYDESDV
jgi:hypothetical protein